jgi:signal transduction histidine kinase
MINDHSQELEQTKLALQMLGEISQFKAGFLGRISHELRSPLSSLLSLHQLILSDLCEDYAEEREFIEQSYQAASKLMRLIDELVTISKLEAGTQALDIEALAVSQCLRKCHQSTYLQAANRGVKLEITQTNQEIYIRADRRRIEQALVMLTDSTIANLAEGTVRISASIVDAQTVTINLDIPDFCEIWNEPINLLQDVPEFNREMVKNLSQNLDFSPGMKLLLAQNLIETMKGSLTITELLVENKSFIRLQCLLPAETAESLIA